MAKKQTTKAKPRGKLKSKIEEASDICFVIMPFGGWLDKYYEEIYHPAISAVGLEPHRADDLFRPSTIVNDIWSYTKRAKLLLADLTDKNPNVFYELGLAHALAKPVILVAESMDDIPFDLRALRIITYDKNAPNWGDVLKSKVESSIQEVLKSPAEAVLPAFLEVKKEVGKTIVTGREREFIEMKQEIDLLRREMRSRSIDLPVREIIGPEEAQALIRNMQRRGLPDDEIVRRVASRGAPKNWVRQEIEAIRSRAKPTSVETPVKPGEGDPGADDISKN